MSLSKYCLLILFFTIAISASGQDINWMTWEAAAAANTKVPKKIFVDVYTDWCGWCKKMDATTFKDPSVVAILNSSFYPVKLNAEQKESIKWKGQEFKWVAGGRDGYQQLAYELLDGQLSYPTYVLLDEEYSRILISPGYKAGDAIMKELKFGAENHYKSITWEAYKTKS